MAKSAAGTGSYYKLRSKRFLEAEGFTVALLERLQLIPPKVAGGRMIPIKRDQLGSDLLAVSADRIVFVQVKFGRNNVAAGRKAFAAFPCPRPAEQWILVWTKGAREPDVIVCSEGS
jgi:hypothetical protein